MVSALVISVMLMAVSNWWTVRLANRIESSAECRFDKNAAIADVNDKIDAWTARVIQASVTDDDKLLDKANQEIVALTDEFFQLIETRSHITEEC